MSDPRQSYGEDDGGGGTDQLAKKHVELGAESNKRQCTCAKVIAPTAAVNPSYDPVIELENSGSF